MPWDSSAMGTPVSVLNLQLLCTGTMTDTPQNDKDCCLSHFPVCKAADLSLKGSSKSHTVCPGYAQLLLVLQLVIHMPPPD